MKLEQEMQEKARQSQYDGKSPMNQLISASNKGMTPAQKRMFNFAEQTRTPKGEMQSEISQSDISEMDQNNTGAAAYFGQTRGEIGGTGY